MANIIFKKIGKFLWEFVDSLTFFLNWFLLLVFMWYALSLVPKAITHDTSAFTFNPTQITGTLNIMRVIFLFLALVALLNIVVQIHKSWTIKQLKNAGRKELLNSTRIIK